MFFFFLVKITRQIEITIGDEQIGEKSQNKLVYFPVPPESFFLENETKKEIYDDINLTSRRADF